MLRRRRASTLVETIVALVLLTGCILLVGALLQRSNRYQQRSESLLEASCLADKVMGDVREWAQNGANYDGNWSFWQGRQVSDPDFPGLLARVDVQTTGLKVYSPDRLTEDAFPGAQREMVNGSVLVRVTSGKDLASPAGRMQIWSLVAPPSPEVAGANIQVTASGGPMTFNDSRTFTARAFDGTGRELPQCCFEWRVLSEGGEVTSLGQSRDGRSFGIRYDQTREDDSVDPPVTVWASGNVRVQAEARIMGKLIKGSTLMSLAAGPPP